jgi:hypothetical protein
VEANDHRNAEDVDFFATVARDQDWIHCGNWVAFLVPVNSPTVDPVVKSIEDSRAESVAKCPTMARAGKRGSTWLRRPDLRAGGSLPTANSAAQTFQARLEV